MRAFSRLMAATLVATTPPAVDPQALNVGDCGCGGSGSCGGGGGCVCTPTPPTWPPGFPVPPGWTIDGGGNLVGPGGPLRPTGTPDGTPVPVPILPPGSAQTPSGLANDAAYQSYARAGYGGQMCVPYKDAVKDCLFMKTVASPLTAVGIGATVNVDLSPAQGWFDMYYIDVVAYLTGGVDAGPDSFNMTIPTVVGCPTNACDTGLPINRRFFAANDGCCCGRPFRAIVPATSQGTPLRTAVTNLNAAAITVQVVGRGFCQSNRICV